MKKNLPLGPVTEHPDDKPQNRYEAILQLGQFNVQSGTVSYHGSVKKNGCKCDIVWSSDLLVLDTPGITTREDGILGDALSVLGVPTNARQSLISKEPVKVYVCCKN